jgi:hypothetical protein
MIKNQLQAHATASIKESDRENLKMLSKRVSSLWAKGAKPPSADFLL